MPKKKLTVAPGVAAQHMSSGYGSFAPGTPIRNGQSHILHLYVSTETTKRVKDILGYNLDSNKILHLVTTLNKFRKYMHQILNIKT